MAGSAPAPDRKIDYFEALGMMTQLALQSPLHRRWYIGDIEVNFLPALHAGQCKIYLDENRLPTSLVTWALVDDEASTLLKEHGRTPPHDRWSAGDNLWFIDVIAPFGHPRHLIRDLHDNHFPAVDVAHAVRRNPDGSIRRIQTWRRK